MSTWQRDHYFHKAKKNGYMARAAYKLEEIQKKHKILKRGSRVLDLGAAPGSWIQVCLKFIGPTGFVVGVDLQPVRAGFPENVHAMERDVFDGEVLSEIRGRYGRFNVVLSDMAPKTSGIKVADAARSELLFERALEYALALLVPGGHFCAKIFQGSGFHDLIKETKGYFRRVKVVKPQASLKRSKEIYILAMHFKGHQAG